MACWGVESFTWAQPTVRIPLPEKPGLFHYNVSSARAVWRISIWRKLNGTVGPAMQPRTKCQPLWLSFCRRLAALQDGRQQGRWADSVWFCTELWAVRSVCSDSFLNQTGDQMSRREKLSGVHQGKELLPEHTSSHFLQTHKGFVLCLGYLFIFYPQGYTTPKLPRCCILIFLFVRSWLNISCIYY